MRDDSHRWAAPRDWSQPVQLGALRLHRVRDLRQTFLSGPDVLRDPALGWPDVAPAGAYRVCLRRDRVLEVGGPARSEGWDCATGLAVSDISEGLAILDLSGRGAFAVLQRGAELSLGQRSRSATRLLFRMAVTLYRTDVQSFRLHVACAMAEGLALHLSRAAEAVGRDDNAMTRTLAEDS